ncbi:MAG: Fe-S cluster assembly protein SufD [Bacteroidetes bacterium]|nr:Fe-S cluster assembly protein SufD [Bacteroidota bacterium]
MGTENKELKEWYKDQFVKFEKRLNGHSKSFMQKYRVESLKKFDEFELPNMKNEEWKYTNVRPIFKHNFRPAVLAEKVEVTRQLVDKKLYKQFDCNVMVFVNGQFEPAFSKLDCLPEGVLVDSLEKVLHIIPELVENKITKLSATENSFNALNGAFALDGAFIYVPAGKIVEKPIQVLFLGGSKTDDVLIQPRNLIIAEESAQVSVIANYQPIDSDKYFTNIITEVYAGKNSIIDLYKIQNEGSESYHVEKMDVHQDETSVFSHYSLSFGGSIVRNDVNSTLDGEHIECNLFGLYLGNNDQHVDNHTFIDHAKPNCVSNELYKGILDGKSRGVFNGKVMVREDAQKTLAYQSNKTVLLSDHSRIDTKPQLEIFADDVKCSHGATVGHLDDQAYFYIRSRGVPSDIAKSMLIRAFVSDVFEKIKITELRDQINRLIFEHLQRVEI